MTILKKEVCSIQGLNCIISFPDTYNPQDKHPTILFLHGAGSRGEDLEVLKNNPYFLLTSGHVGFPFLTFAPQCSKNSWFDHFESLEALVTEISDYDFVDSSRIYLMGASMGGYATWQLAMSMPEKFAAIVPICGGGMYWNVGRISKLPIWAFHGALDKCVLVEESVKIVERVNQKGGNAKLTIYPNNAHDAWSDTYSNYEVFQWLLEHKSKAKIECSDEYKGAKQYG